ncbi:unnamed protein product [Cochlearia groenlandica]
MGKQGPCYHCGVTSTPLWRNGPPEKPVLCNACGSRWRTKGSLVNYTPLHSRADSDEIDMEDHRSQRMMMIVKGISVNKKIPKRKSYQETFTVKRTDFEFKNGFKKKALEEEASNRSSSGSVVSNSESCDQCNAWETVFPCKKRACVGRPKAASSVEKLTKDLFSILQEQQSSCLSGSSEEDLLFENETPMLLGHGSVLMRDHHSCARDEESEASSLLVESGKSSTIHSVKAIKQEQLKRTKSQVLGRHSSQLCSIDLKYVFNFDEFVEKFTEEEKKKLMKLLPQVDSVSLPDSLISMFDSSQFKENFSLFRQLVADGVFETSLSSSSSSFGSKVEDLKTFAKLALSDPNKSHLLESYYMLKEQRKAIEDSNPSPSDNNNSLVTIERPCESLNQNFSETRLVMRSPKEVMKIRSKHVETEEVLEKCVSSFGGSMVFGYDDSDQDLLLDVPSNGSFPQAELLHMI